MLIAWDIETCPLPFASYSETQRKRLEQQLIASGAPGASPDDEPALKARSLHPALGWICCLSVTRADRSGRVYTPKSYLAAIPGEERALLEAFWNDVARFGDRKITWITFNGKRFDVEFLLTRTLYHGLFPTRADLLDQYPYSFTPHCDLMTVWCRSAMRLEDVCELLGVESPKQGMDGSRVGHAVADGRVD